MAGSQGSTVEPDAPEGVECPSCGSSNPPGNRFCGSCGSALERVCPACGTANPPDNRFCGACGTGLDAATAPPGAPAAPAAAIGTARPAAVPELEERKVVTVLFADLTGSTELATSMDAEDLRPVLTAYFSAMAEEIDRHGGTVEKFIGDAIVAVFGVPVAHEDDPERAVRTAIAMQARMPALNADLRGTRGVELMMRVGVNTGDVVTATGIDREGLVTGTPVNLAARLEALARPGAIVVGERTHRDTRHAIAYRSLGEVERQGVRPARPGLRGGRRAGRHPRRPPGDDRRRADGRPGPRDRPAPPGPRPHRTRRQGRPGHRDRAGRHRQEPPGARVPEAGPGAPHAGPGRARPVPAVR